MKNKINKMKSKNTILFRVTLRMAIILFAGLGISSLFGCQSNQAKEAHNHEMEPEQQAHGAHGSHDGAEVEHEGGEEDHGLFLSNTQIKTIGLEFGDFSSVKIEDYVKATGTLGVPPNGYSSVSAKAAGILRVTKKFVEGNTIRKGELIARVTHPDFIAKQQAYLEAKALLKLKKLELKRQEDLISAHAGVPKNLQKAQAELEIQKAKTLGLAKQLAYLGISTEKLTPETIRKDILVTAPITGYISRVTMHNGKYVEPTTPLMEILSDHHIHLELDVFEKDIAKVRTGQKISYSIPALGNEIYQGEVSVIGKEFDSRSKTMRVHGHLTGKHPMFLKDLFLNARIWLNDATAQALPEDAIVKDDNGYFIYAGRQDAHGEGYSFVKIMVVTGISYRGFTSVRLIDPVPEGMQIVTKGAYYVFAKSKAGELEHEH